MDGGIVWCSFWLACRSPFPCVPRWGPGPVQAIQCGHVLGHLYFVHVLSSAAGVHFVASLWCSGLWLAWGSDQRLRVYPMFCRWICGIARVAPSECGDYFVAGLALCRVAG